MSDLSISRIGNGYLVSFYVPHFMAVDGDTHRQYAYPTLDDALAFARTHFTPVAMTLGNQMPVEIEEIRITPGAVITA